jgi:phage gp45-like
MTILQNVLRWASIRKLTEGRMQSGRVEGVGPDARDGAMRPQDYGYASNPVDGQGLRMEVGGHTIIIRMDRLAERPQLAAYEVAVWHKEGHMVRLRAGRVVQVDCDQYIVNTQQYQVNASVGATFTTPNLTASQAVTAQSVSSQSVAAATSMKVGGKEVAGHNHGNVQNGGGVTAGF